jgi:hypothetical protein
MPKYKEKLNQTCFTKMFFIESLHNTILKNIYTLIVYSIRRMIYPNPNLGNGGLFIKSLSLLWGDFISTFFKKQKLDSNRDRILKFKLKN